MVIDAIGDSRTPPKSIAYAILGLCTPQHQSQLEVAIKRNRCDETIRILGEVSPGVLRSYLTHADICVNLRFPAIEGASGSVIEEMFFAKPVIVNDIGFFRELPGECVIKIKPNSHQALVAALGRLINDGKLREQLGSKAREFAQVEFKSGEICHRYPGSRAGGARGKAAARFVRQNWC